jgi:pimeloyl-ACP methyl ester carboxylesterase
MTAPAADIERVRSADGTEIAYRRVGAGPPVVVMHGALASSLSWLAVAQRLADRFMFLLADRRGRGASGDGTARHALGRAVEDAQALLAVPVAVRR